MPADPNIGNREREILTAIVETTFATASPWVAPTLGAFEPRGAESGLHPQRDGRTYPTRLSGATACFHCGRVPTTEAYRYYVEQISGSASVWRRKKKR